MMQIAISRCLRRFAQCQKGNVLVEFGLVATLLMGTVVGAMEFTAVMGQTTKISNAARAAAEHAMKDPAATTEITNVAVRSGNLDPATLNVTVNTFCECPGIGSVPCGDTCAGGITNYSYVTVSLSQPAQSFFQGHGFLTGVTVARSATMQMR